MKIGAAVTIDRLEENLSWFIDDQRDIEIQDWAQPNAFSESSTKKIGKLNNLLDGYNGRMGVHAPYIGLNIGCVEKCVQELARDQFKRMLEVVSQIHATHMVIHSPFFYFGDAFIPHISENSLGTEIEAVHETILPILHEAESLGCTLVIENIFDKNTHALLALVDSFESDFVKLSIDTGHAHIHHVLTNSPTVDTWAKVAGRRLGHIHLQDTDGRHDRHWQPGKGTINWQALFDTVESLDIEPRMILEVKDYIKGWSFLKSLRLAE